MKTFILLHRIKSIFYFLRSFLFDLQHRLGFVEDSFTSHPSKDQNLDNYLSHPLPSNMPLFNVRLQVSRS